MMLPNMIRQQHHEQWVNTLSEAPISSEELEITVLSARRIVFTMT